MTQHDLKKLRAMLKARTKPDGSPKPGFRRSVASIKARIFVAEHEAATPRFTPTKVDTAPAQA